MNKQADKLAKQGVEDPLQEIDMSSPWTPRGWVDDAPILNHQLLAHLTYCVVWETTPNPLFRPKWAGFCAKWTEWMATHFGAELDVTKHLPTLWRMNTPAGFKELLWKSASGSLPLGHHWYGELDLGRQCQCGTKLSLCHIWASCPSYDLAPLRNVLLEALPNLCPRPHQTLDFNKWPSPHWYPLLALKALEKQLPLATNKHRHSVTVGAPKSAPLAHTSGLCGSSACAKLPNWTTSSCPGSWRRHAQMHWGSGK